MKRTLAIAACLALIAGGEPWAQGQQGPSLALPEQPTYDHDVVVLGGGPSGVAAAIAAARHGASVLLVEQYAQLGGMGTSGGVNVFMQYRHTGGIFREVIRRCADNGGMRGSTFDIATMVMTLDQLLAEAGVEVLFHTRGIAVVTEPGNMWAGARPGQQRHVRYLVIHNKSGVQTCAARVFVDCSGDGDLCSWAGAPHTIGRPEDGLAQPMTMMFKLAGHTYTGGTPRHPALEGIHMSIYHNPNGEITFNMTRISGLLGCSGEDLSRAEIDGRKMVLEYVKLIKDNIPGFENAYLVGLPVQIGVRETRHIEGATVLTADDVLNGRERGDVVARCSYNVDVHNPAGKGAQIIRLEEPYDIPYRCLIPRGLDNVLVAGRPISADHVAHSSLRIQPNCYALGQAAGTAAAMCVERRIGPWEMNPHLGELQAALLRDGADLGPRLAQYRGLKDEWEAWRAEYGTGARPWPTSFNDIPEGHPLREAAAGLARAHVFRGYPDGNFGVDQVAPRHIVVVVIARALQPDEGKWTGRADLPANVSGAWWSGALRELIARGAIPQADLPGFSPDASVGTDELKLMLGRAFNCGDLPEHPEQIRLANGVTRGALAWYLWEAMKHKP